MSNLLKEAIVDAKALRDSALKNAEATIIEKYSQEVKNTMDQLLEQDEGLMGEEAGSDEVVAKNIPLAATDGLSEEEGDIPNNMNEEGEEVPVTIDLQALQEAVAELSSEMNEDDTEESPLSEADDEEIEITEEALAAMLESDEEIIEEEDDVKGEEGESKAESSSDQDEAAMRGMEEANLAQRLKTAFGFGGESKAERDKRLARHAAAEKREKEALANQEARRRAEEEEERRREIAYLNATGGGLPGDYNPYMYEENLDTDALVDAIMEKLTVDMGAELAGWAGRSADDQKFQMEKELARRRSTDVAEELETLKKAQEELVFENKQLTEKLSNYEEAVGQLRESLQDVNLSNGRLLYTNRVLRNPSLNERQKEKIVEAISNAGSVTDAKVIYETLQSAVETKPKRSPKTLSEAISNKRASVLRATRQESAPSDPLQERMKRLAGIK